MAKFTLTKSVAGSIAKIIANATDHGGQMVTMRGLLAQQYKGAPAQMLDDTAKALLVDAFTAEYESRKTVKPESVGPLVTNAVKVARCMPVILRAKGEDADKVAGSWGALTKFSTKLQKCDGDFAEAMKLVRAEARKGPNYAKSAAAHFKALLNMKDGKMWTPKQKGAIVEAAATCGIEL